jgi:hypothetical protein
MPIQQCKSVPQEFTAPLGHQALIIAIPLYVNSILIDVSIDIYMGDLCLLKKPSKVLYELMIYTALGPSSIQILPFFQLNMILSVSIPVILCFMLL